MDAKQAIGRAKGYFGEIFSEEGVTNVGLEEVRREGSDENWLITLGFSWIWDSKSAISAMTGRAGNLPRFYKVVRIKNSDGSLISITNRSVSGE